MRVRATLLTYLGGCALKVDRSAVDLLYPEQGRDEDAERLRAQLDDLAAASPTRTGPGTP